ncbi:hypothetical protein CEP52_014305 [Fusarium oligoseptatum]|uniref:CSC1/OSCA1-like N-terminal transmembrane domain-containing protein n=2 Tax=Fusarium solani species complex TaxID=232080 RepID=A0A428SNE6_9HYPO|nr:hypothetical protein CEP52_014305 [Fusarium oligoseptatum]
MDAGNVVRLFSRQDGKDPGQELLELLKNPYNDQLQAASMYSALAISLPVTIFIAFCFSLLRPYHQAIYAPKMKHADEKHAPPPIGKAPWSWITTLWNTKEEQLVYLIGMDATIFLRFVRMCRNMFLTLCLTGVGILLPVHVSHWTKIGDDNGNTWVSKITPLHVWGKAIWAQVVIAWAFNIIIAIYLWVNYRKVLQLRRKYF